MKLLIGTTRGVSTATEQAVVYTEADLYPDEGIELKRKLLTAEDLAGTSTEFTHEFNLPATEENKKLFKHYESKAVTDGYNPNKAILARIEVFDMVSIPGTIELLSVTWKMGVPQSFSIAFYGEASGLRTLIGGTLMEDLDWSAFSFLITDTNIKESWTLSNDHDYFVPMIGWNRPIHIDGGVSTSENNIANPLYGIRVEELRVGFRFTKVLEIIAESFGANFVFDALIADHLEQAFVVPSRYEDKYALYSASSEDTDVESNTPIPLPHAPDPAVTLVLPIINSDPKGRWIDNYKYRADYVGTYQFRIAVQTTTNKTCRRTLYLYNETDSILVNSWVGDNTKNDVFNIVEALEEGKEYSWGMDASKSGEIADIQFTVEVVPTSPYDKEYVANDVWPIITVVDFLVESLRTFNLVLLPTAEIGTYTIIDLNSMFAGQGVFDIDPYVSNDVITYKKIPVSEVVDFKHADSEDYANVLFEEVAGRWYGQEVISANVNFSTGRNEQQSIFTVFPPARMPKFIDGVYSGSYPMSLHVQMTNDAPPKPTKADFMLMYRNDALAIDETWYLQNGVDASGEPTFDPLAFWGYYSQVQDLDATNESNSLAFSEENALNGVKVYNGIINKFWFDWLLQIYKNTSYKVDVKFPVNYGAFKNVTRNNLQQFNGFNHILTEWVYHSDTNILEIGLFRYDAINSYIPLYVVHGGIQVVHLDVDVIHFEGQTKVTRTAGQTKIEL